jgi:hypothetical protein
MAQTLDPLQKEIDVTKKTLGGIIVFCSDPRPENANLWKHSKLLLIPQEQRLTPIGLLGAPVALARPADFPVKFAAVMEDITFALEEFADGRFIVVGHDCGIYKRLEPKKFSIGDKMEDIARAAHFLRKRFPGMPVTAYFKKAGPGFETIS